MRPPTIKFGDWQIKYKQIPYEDRYFFVFYKKYEVAKISSVVFVDLKWWAFPFGVHTKLHNQEDRIAAFEQRVKEYDDHWDRL